MVVGGAGAAEASAHNDVQVAGAEAIEHFDHVFHLMLTIRIEGDKVPRPRLGAGIFHPRLQGRALSQVDGMVDQVCARSFDLGGGVVGGAVVDGHHVGEHVAHVTDHIANDCAFIEAGDDHPRVCVIQGRIIHESTHAPSGGETTFRMLLSTRPRGVGDKDYVSPGSATHGAWK